MPTHTQCLRNAADYPDTHNNNNRPLQAAVTPVLESCAAACWCGMCYAFAQHHIQHCYHLHRMLVWFTQAPPDVLHWQSSIPNMSSNRRLALLSPVRISTVHNKNPGTGCKAVLQQQGPNKDAALFLAPAKRYDHSPAHCASHGPAMHVVAMHAELVILQQMNACWCNIYPCSRTRIQN